MKKKVLFEKVIVAIAAFFLSSNAQAQERFETSLGADLVSAYRWRGQDLGGFSVQPSVSVSKSGFSLTAWGSVALDRSGDNFTDELDFTLAYQTGGLKVGVTDYFCIPGGFKDADYFMYEAHRTAHVFEASLGYDFGFLALTWNTNFAGNDYYKDGGTKRAYSSYMEVTAPFALGGVDFTAEVGATPWYGAYKPQGGDGFSVVNVGLTASKDIKIADFVLPLSVKLGANPETEEAYVVFGLHF